MSSLEQLVAEDAHIAPSGTFVAPGNQEEGGNAPSIAFVGGSEEFPMNLKFAALPDGRLRFKQPLSVRLSKDNGTYVAQCIEIDQFGYGSDSGEALDDLSRTLAEMFIYLSDADRSGSLGEALTEQYALLREFIEPSHVQTRAA
jgi:hypothetical protein